MTHFVLQVIGPTQTFIYGHRNA